tara:strand:- start:240 stop:980 length:741 start_codon:yes stop_codon:yes gene_type:complete
MIWDCLGICLSLNVINHKSITMKKIILILISTMSFGQTRYWTSYNVTIEPENIEAVYNLFDDYFKSNPTSEDVDAYLYENHFRDYGNNYTHSFIWAGSLEGMGAQYAPKENNAWELLITKASQLIKETHSASMGNTLVNVGENKPIQRYFYLDVEDPEKYLIAFKKSLKFRSKDRQTLLGGFSAGLSPDGESHWVIVGFDDMKSAMDPGAFRRSNPEAQKSWDEYRKNRGNSRLVRSGLRLLMGSW